MASGGQNARKGQYIIGCAWAPERFTVFVNDLRTICKPFTNHIQTIYANRGSVHLSCLIRNFTTVRTVPIRATPGQPPHLNRRQLSTFIYNDLSPPPCAADRPDTGGRLSKLLIRWLQKDLCWGSQVLPAAVLA